MDKHSSRMGDSSWRYNDIGRHADPNVTVVEANDTIPKLTSMSENNAVGDVLNVAEDDAWYESCLPIWEARARLWPGQCDHPSVVDVELTELQKYTDRYIFMMCDECGCISNPDPLDPAFDEGPDHIKRFSAEKVSDLLRRSSHKPNMDYEFYEIHDGENWQHPTLTWEQYRSAWFRGERR